MTINVVCPRCEQTYLTCKSVAGWPSPFFVCIDECEAVWFGPIVTSFPEDNLSVFLRRNGFVYHELIDADECLMVLESRKSFKPTNEELLTRTQYLRDNRNHTASQLARFLATRFPYGQTLSLLIQRVFLEAFPEIPELLLGDAAVKWTVFSEEGADLQFDLLLQQWIGPHRSRN